MVQSPGDGKGPENISLYCIFGSNPKLRVCPPPHSAARAGNAQVAILPCSECKFEQSEIQNLGSKRSL